MRVLQAGLIIAAFAFPPGLATAAQPYNCANAAEEVLFISQENRSPFAGHIIGLVQQQELLKTDGRIVCQALGLLSTGAREEVRYSAYFEYDQWWIQYEARSESGYDDILLLDHERAERAADIDELPQRIADLLRELNTFPAELFAPGTPPLTIQLKLSEFGFLEAMNRVTETGAAVPLSFLDDREGAVMRTFASSFSAPLWQQAAPVSLTWTFTATPSRNPGSPPTISWPGGPMEVAETALASSPDQSATTPQDKLEVTEVAEVAPSAPASSGKTKPPRLVCAYSIERLSNGLRQMIGRGQLALRNAELTLLDGEWLTEGSQAEDAFDNFALTVAGDGTISGTIPVYFLFAEPNRPMNEPVLARIELPSANGTMPHNGEVEFPLDHVFTGVFTLAGCVSVPR